MAELTEQDRKRFKALERVTHEMQHLRDTFTEYTWEILVNKHDIPKEFEEDLYEVVDRVHQILNIELARIRKK